MALAYLRGQRPGRRCSVHADGVLEAPQHYVADLHHEVLAHGATRVGQAVLETGTGRVQEQAWRLYGIAADENDLCLLFSLVSVGIEIGNSRHALIFPHIDARDHAVGANLGSMTQRIRDMADERALLCSHLAALDAEPSI